MAIPARLIVLPSRVMKTVDKASIQEFIENQFLVSFGADVDDSTNLFEGGFVDSYGYIELISYLESEYEVSFTEDELVSSDLASLNSIVELIGKKVANV